MIGPPLRRRLTALLPGGGLRGHVLTLLSGSSAAIALAYLAQPVLTRLYSPADFGTMDAFVALVATLGPLLALRYDDAVLLPEHDRDAAAVLWLCILLSAAGAALSMVLVPLSGPFASLLGQPSLAVWIAMVPPTLVLFRVLYLAEQWLKRHRRFTGISAGEVTLALGTVGTRLGAVLLVAGIGAAGLIGGYAAGLLAAGLVLATLAARTAPAALRAGLRRDLVTAAARRYRRFPLFSTPALLLKSLTAVLPTLLLLAFFDERVVGHYGRAFMVLSAPLLLVGRAVGKVFHAEAARRLHTGGLDALTRAVHARVVTLALFPTLALMLAGPDVLRVVLGAEWVETGRYLRLLGPWLFLTAVTVPFFTLFDVLERQRRDLVLSAAMFALQTGALVVAARTGDVIPTLAALGAAGALVRALHLSVMMRLARVPAPALLGHYARAGALALPLLAPVALAMLYAPPLGVTAVAAACGPAYLALAWRLGWL